MHIRDDATKGEFGEHIDPIATRGRARAFCVTVEKGSRRVAATPCVVAGLLSREGSLDGAEIMAREGRGPG